MRTATLAVFAAAVPSTFAAVYKGFNYGSTFTDGSFKTEADYEGDFNSAKNLEFTDHTFTSARLYTMIQGGTTNTPISAIPAAITTNTTLLLGLWASAGDASFANEIAALTAASSQYGTDFTKLIAGISVGSEDIYRITPLGVASKAGTGADETVIANYVGQVRNAIAGTAASAAPVGHTDTYNVWTNATLTSTLIPAVDFVGMDAYPYYETTKTNSIENANATFWDDYAVTVAAVQGKPIWITETGWPIQGATENLAVPGIANAETYYAEVGCHAFSHGINTWWFTLQDQQPAVPSSGVVFGVAGAGSPPPTTPLYSLAC